jgi:p-aminobenzoyl-glutamate transporter AbgT
MIFKIFSPKNLAKILAFFAQITACFCKNLIITLVFERNAIFSRKIGKNRRKL